MNKCKIAERLTELRNKKGITQAELATALSVSDKVISKWENGISEPALDMLIALADYYGVSTDALLGICHTENRTIEMDIGNIFSSNNRKQTILEAFDVAQAVIPSVMKNINHQSNNDLDIYPEPKKIYTRRCVSTNDFYCFTTKSANVNLAVMLLRNKNNFAWLKENEIQNGIAELFKLLSNPDVLAVFYFLHTTECSSSFTSDYIAKNTGVDEMHVKEILDASINYGLCQKSTAHLVSGDVEIYESYGDGNILSLITLAYEHIFGVNGYEYNYGHQDKMIEGGK